MNQYIDPVLVSQGCRLPSPVVYARGFLFFSSVQNRYNSSQYVGMNKGVGQVM